MTTYRDKENFRNGIRSMVERVKVARRRFVDTLTDTYNLSPSDAEGVAAIYTREKIVRFDAVAGDFRLIHGAFLDAAVLDRAVEQARREELAALEAAQ